MSLDITLYSAEACPSCGHAIGASHVVYDGNITHNLHEMADAAGLNDVLWGVADFRDPAAGAVADDARREGRYEDAIAIRRAIPRARASEVVPGLRAGLEKLLADPDGFAKYNHADWGRYENLVEFVKSFLAACEENPTATIEVSL